MKTNFKIIVFFSFILFTNQANAQLKVYSNGNVGVGYNAPTTKLWIEGSTRFSNWTDLIIDWSGYGPTIYPEANNAGFIGKSGNWFNHIYAYTIDYSVLAKYSDRRLKENVNGLSDVLPKIKKLGTYTYNYKDEYYKGFTSEQKLMAKRKEFGFVADELIDIFPELVYKSDTGYMSVDYVSMIPILTQAIKELQKHIETLDTVVLSQENDIVELKKLVTKLSEKKSSNLKSASISDTLQNVTSTDVLTGLKNAQLYQNSPNPFTINTEIRFQIPQSVKTAILYIHDLQGIEIKSFNILVKGAGSITIQGSELRAGMYIYSLVIDGQIFDSKRMILSNK